MSVSVIIPTYNREKLIGRAIKSALNQTCSEIIEIIVVDDGSTDNTEGVVKSFRDAKIKYEKLDGNYGACHARNYGVTVSEGDYIAFLDSDDYWYPEKLSKQIAYLESTDADLCFHALMRMNAEGIKERIPDESFPAGRIAFTDLIPVNKASTQTFLVRRKCILDDPFDERLPRLQDWELAVRYCLRGYNVVYENEVLCCVEMQADSLSMDTNKGFLATEKVLGMVKSVYENMDLQYGNMVRERERVIREKELLIESERRQSEAFIREKEERIENAERQIEALVRERDAANENANRQHENAVQTLAIYEAVINSTSWRITAPIRRARGLFKRDKETDAHRE